MNIKSKVIPLNIDNIDTDQLIPARFLKSTTKDGYGKNLFYNWRYSEGYTPNSDFELNNPKREGAKIIIGGNNFGCGSSREHAAWAIADYGIQVVISSQFADIHKENLYNNNVLPVEVTAEELSKLMTYFTENETAVLTADMENQTIEVEDLNFKTTFDIPPFKKQCLLEGVDETQYLINMREEIAAFKVSNY